jgi:hypothetical protein
MIKISGLTVLDPDCLDSQVPSLFFPFCLILRYRPLSHGIPLRGNEFVCIFAIDGSLNGIERSLQWIAMV